MGHEDWGSLRREERGDSAGPPTLFFKLGNLQATKQRSGGEVDWKRRRERVVLRLVWANLPILMVEPVLKPGSIPATRPRAILALLLGQVVRQALHDEGLPARAAHSGFGVFVPLVALKPLPPGLADLLLRGETSVSSFLLGRPRRSKKLSDPRVRPLSRLPRRPRLRHLNERCPVDERWARELLVGWLLRRRSR